MRKIGILILCLSLLVIPVSAANETEFDLVYEGAEIKTGRETYLATSSNVNIPFGNGETYVWSNYSMRGNYRNEGAPVTTEGWRWMLGYTYEFHWTMRTTNSLDGVVAREVYLGNFYTDRNPIKYMFGDGNTTFAYTESQPNIMEVTLLVHVPAAPVLIPDTDVLDYRTMILEMDYGNQTGTINWQFMGVTVVADLDGENYEKEQTELLQIIIQNQQNQNDQEYEDALDKVDVDDENFDGDALVPVSSIKDCLMQIVNAVTTSSTTAEWTLPATGIVPYLGVELWEEQTIDFTYWLDKIPVGVLWVVRLGTAVALLGLVFNEAKRCYNKIGGGD